jgi:hypothetical protein
MGKNVKNVCIILEVIQYMLLSHHENGGQIHYIKRDNRSSENVAQFKYLGMTATN